MAQPKLLEQYRERLRVKHYSLRTEDTYLHWIRRFIFVHGEKHPREASFRSSALAYPNAGCGR